MNKRFGARALALFTLLALLCGNIPALAASKQAIVTEDNAAVHAKPKTSSRVLGELPKGEKVTVLAVSGKIAKVKYAGKVGYMKKFCLKLTEDASSGKSSKKKATAVIAAKAQIAPPPGTQSKAVAASTNQLTRKTTRRAVAYLTPSRACKKRTAVRKGTELTVLGMTGEFYKVKRAGQVAYMPQSAFEAVPEKVEPAGESRIILTETKVFKRASRAAKVLGTLAKGEKVAALGESGGFVRIKRADQIGYVPSSAFTQATQAPTPAKPDAVKPPAKSANASKADTVIKAALAQLGKRYVYGTVGPATFDCSGLTYYAYKQVGVTLEHSAASVGYGAGDKVDKAHLQRGDIVCFNTISDSDQSDHVGIYLGGNQFVHASSGQSRVVVSSLTGYYSDNFSWGRRVV